MPLMLLIISDKPQTKKSRSLLGEICGEPNNQHRGAAGLKKRCITHSLSESTKNEISSKVPGSRGVGKDQHYQSLQDLATMVGCENMKSAGVGRGIAKLHNKAIRANSFTHETCVPFEQKKAVHSTSTGPGGLQKTAAKSKQKRNDKQSSPDASGCAQSAARENASFSGDNGGIKLRKSEKAGCVKIDIMDVDCEDDESQERIPLLQHKEDPYVEAVCLNSLGDNFRAVDDGIMLPLQVKSRDIKFANFLS